MTYSFIPMKMESDGMQHAQKNLNLLQLEVYVKFTIPDINVLNFMSIMTLANIYVCFLWVWYDRYEHLVDAFWYNGNTVEQARWQHNMDEIMAPCN